MNAYQKFNQLAEQVTSDVITELQKGKVPWKKPWGTHGLPKNYGSHRPYEGFNAFYLHYITEKNGYSAPYFLTYKQAQALGGHVRKGQKGTPIVYWKVYEREPRAQTAEGRKERSSQRCIPFLWTVFNIDQVDGVDFCLPATSAHAAPQVIEACQQVLDNFPSPQPRVLHGGMQACYAPAPDTVQVPLLPSFSSAEAYHATLFHELIHATGHPMRLNRFQENEHSRFGDESYSKEELIAEMGASFLCAFTGINAQVFQNSVAYLQGWVSRFREDSTLILYAGNRAFKAATYILGLKAEASMEALPEEQATF